jgi:hypothetical protein
MPRIPRRWRSHGEDAPPQEPQTTADVTDQPTQELSEGDPLAHTASPPEASANGTPDTPTAPFDPVGERDAGTVPASEGSGTPAQPDDQAAGGEAASAQQPDGEAGAEQPPEGEAGAEQPPESEAAAEQPPEDARPGFRHRARMRRRLRYLRRRRELAFRDLGGLMFDLHRFGRERADLVRAKLDTLSEIDHEMRTLETALRERRDVTELREVGIAGCPRCGTLHGTDANFCPGCGTSLRSAIVRDASPVTVTPADEAPPQPPAAPAAGTPAAGAPAVGASGAGGTPPPATAPPGTGPAPGGEQPTMPAAPAGAPGDQPAAPAGSASAPGEQPTPTAGSAGATDEQPTMPVEPVRDTGEQATDERS